MGQWSTQIDNSNRNPCQLGNAHEFVCSQGSHGLSDLGRRIRLPFQSGNHPGSHYFSLSFPIAFGFVLPTFGIFHLSLHEVNNSVAHTQFSSPLTCQTNQRNVSVSRLIVREFNRMVNDQQRLSNPAVSARFNVNCQALALQCNF